MDMYILTEENFLIDKNLKQLIHKLEAKDVLPNINRTQAAERAEKCRFMSLVTLTFDL